MPSRPACRADLPAEPICNLIRCPPSRSALRPDLHADSRSSRREICSPKLARLRVCTLSDLHFDSICTSNRAVHRADLHSEVNLHSYSDPICSRSDLHMSTRSVLRPTYLNSSSATRAPCQRTPPSRSALLRVRLFCFAAHAMSPRCPPTSHTHPPERRKRPWCSAPEAKAKQRSGWSNVMTIA